MKQIILTGGGTAGHVTPNIALLPSLAAAGYQVTYIGSYTGIEKQLIEDLGITYYGIYAVIKAGKILLIHFVLLQDISNQEN